LKGIVESVEVGFLKVILTKLLCFIYKTIFVNMYHKVKAEIIQTSIQD